MPFQHHIIADQSALFRALLCEVLYARVRHILAAHPVPGAKLPPWPTPGLRIARLFPVPVRRAPRVPGQTFLHQCVTGGAAILTTASYHVSWRPIFRLVVRKSVLLGREGQHRLAGHLACLEAVETLVVGISWGTFAKPRPFWWDLVASLICRAVHPPELVRGICGCFLGLMVYLDPDQLVGSLHQMVGPGRKCLCFSLFPGSSPSFAEVSGSPLRCVCAQVVKD